jgi:hypothetical protein
MQKYPLGYWRLSDVSQPSSNSYPYWRIRVTSLSGGGNDIKIANIEMRATVSGADQCTGGTAFATSGAGSVDNAFDGQTATNWTSDASYFENESIGYEFIPGVVVAEIAITASSTAGVSNSPGSFVVEHSEDGIVYTPVATFDSLTWTNSEVKVFDIVDLCFDETFRNHGTYVNDPTREVTGHVDGSDAVTFDGVDQHVTLPDAGIFDFGASDTFSFSFCFKTAMVADGCIISKKEGSAYSRGWEVYMRSDGKLAFRIVGGTVVGNAIEVYETTTARNDDAWYHAVVTYSGTGTVAGMKIYVDGFPRGVTNVATGTVGTVSNTGTPCIGAINAAGTYFDGELTEITVFDYELSVEEVKEMYYASESNTGYAMDVLLSNPHDYLRLNESIASTPPLTDVEPNKAIPYNQGLCPGSLFGTANGNNASSLVLDPAGQSWAFDGVDHLGRNSFRFLQFGSNGRIAFEFWFVTTTTSASGLWSAMDHGNTSYLTVHINESATGELSVGNHDHTVNLRLGTGNPELSQLNDGKVHHVVIYDIGGSYQNSNIEAYIDGLKVPAQNVTWALAWSLVDNLYFGASYRNGAGGNKYLNGVMDELAVLHHTGFTPDEQRQLFRRHHTHGRVESKGGFSFHALYLAPAAYFRLGEDGGTVCGDFMGRYNGSYVGSPTLNVEGLLVNDNNKCVTFTGSNYADLTSVWTVDYYHAFSIYLLIQTSGAGTYTLVSKMDTAGSNQGINVEMANGIITFQIYSAGAGTGISITSTGSAINDGNIHEVCVTYDGSNVTAGMTIYVDNVAQTNSSSSDLLGTNSILNTASLCIGSLDSGSQNFVGTIDEVLLYNYELGAEELKRLHWARLGWFGFSLIGLMLDAQHVWSLNDAGPTTIVDSVGTLNGTAVGSPTFEQPSLVRSRPDTYSIRFYRGSNQYISLGSSAVLSGSAFSIMCLVDITTSGAVIPIYTERASATNVLSLKILADNTVEFRVYENLTNHVATSTGTVLPGKVYFICATLHASTGMKVYIDGLLDGTDASTNVPVDTITAVYGGYDGSAYFDGWLDGLTVFNYALSEAEIQKAYSESLLTEDLVPLVSDQILGDEFIGSEALLIQLGASFVDELVMSDVPGQQEIIAEAINFLDEVFSKRYTSGTVTEGVIGADTVASVVGKHIFEYLLTNGDLLSEIKAYETQIDSMRVSGLVKLAFNLAVTEGSIFADATIEKQVRGAILTDTLVVSGLVTNELKAAIIAAETIVLVDIATSGKGAEATDAVQVAETVGAVYNAIVSQLDSTLFADASVLTPRLNVILSDTTEISDSIDVNWAIIEALQDGVVFGGSLVLPDGVYTAMVLNTESLGISEYDNYPFNSFGKLGQTYLGATDSAIYSLAGDTDDGANIDAVIRSGMTNFGTNIFKRVPRAYLGYTSTGALIMKTLSTSGGVKTERWYELTPRTADAPTAARIQLGRGIKATYWQFELVNKSGADFDISSLQLLPMILNRRV